MRGTAALMVAAGVLVALTACGSGQGTGYSTPSTGVVTFTPTPAATTPLPADSPTYDPAPTTKATTAPLN